MNSVDATKKISFAFCTFNRAARLETLVNEMRTQVSHFPFEILAINNNSQDNTLDILEHLAKQNGPKLRYVTETVQGIVAARNRAIQEALDSDILIFIDDDEIPLPGLVSTACDAIFAKGANCVGGRVRVDFSCHLRPKWLGDDLLGFLAEVNHGDLPFWIISEKTPIWTANIAYDMRIFRNDHSLKFDKRYDRKGKSVGGGEDFIMLKMLLSNKFKILYHPDMVVLHSVEEWRLSRRYFIQLHFKSGYMFGLNEMNRYKNTLFGYPPFMIIQLFKQTIKAVLMILTSNKNTIRQCMNVAHTLGCLIGYKKFDSIHFK